MKKVLLVEDDALLCWLLEKILTNKNYDVTVMNDGKEAWSWLTNDHIPDLIVSDLRMPSLGGLELLENISKSATLKRVPVIIHSGDEAAGKRKQCLDLGAFSYLVKPFEPEFLVTEIERAIESSDENIMAK